MRASAIVLPGAALAIAVLAWWCWRVDDVAPDLTQHGSDRSQQGERLDPAHAATSIGSPDISDANRERVDAPSTVTAASSKQREEPGQEWTVQLVGLRPQVPWESSLELIFEKRFGMVASVNADGLCRFLPPAGARNPGIQHMELRAKDANYRLTRSGHRTDYLQAEGHVEVDVQPIARLRGRVLGPDRVPRFARVRAFRWRAHGPSAPLLGLAYSEGDGRYELEVPPDVPLVLVADVVGSGTDLPARSLSLFDSPAVIDRDVSVSTVMLAGADLEGRREDMLPAWQQVQGVFSKSVDVADMVLSEPSELRGQVVLADGAALPHVEVTARPQWAKGRAFYRDLFFVPTDRIVRGASVVADENGAFALPLLAGVSYELSVGVRDGVARGPARWVLLDPIPAVTATPPGHVELPVPGRALMVLVVEDGAPARRSVVEIDDASWQVGPDGRLRAVLPRRGATLRARAPERSSSPLTVSFDSGPSVVTLELVSESTADVKLSLTHADELRDAIFVWQPLTGGAPFEVRAQRAGPGEPFSMRVAAGRYSLRVQEDVALRDRYLLPLAEVVEVPQAGLVDTYALRHGGRLRLHAVDGHGLRVGGTFTLLDEEGRDVTPRGVPFRFAEDAQPGEFGTLFEGAPTLFEPVFAPGTYRLSVVGPGEIRGERMVEVVARKTRLVTMTLR